MTCADPEIYVNQKRYSEASVRGLGADRQKSQYVSRQPVAMDYSDVVPETIAAGTKFASNNERPEKPETVPVDSSCTGDSSLPLGSADAVVKSAEKLAKWIGRGVRVKRNTGEEVDGVLASVQSMELRLSRTTGAWSGSLMDIQCVTLYEP